MKPVIWALVKLHNLIYFFIKNCVIINSGEYLKFDDQDRGGCTVATLLKYVLCSCLLPFPQRPHWQRANLMLQRMGLPQKTSNAGRRREPEMLLPSRLLLIILSVLFIMCCFSTQFTSAAPALPRDESRWKMLLFPVLLATNWPSSVSSLGHINEISACFFYVHETVQALKEILRTLGKTDWDFSADPSGRRGIPGSENYISCDCSYSSGTICHVSKM